MSALAYDSRLESVAVALHSQLWAFKVYTHTYVPISKNRAPAAAAALISLSWNHRGGCGGDGGGGRLCLVLIHQLCHQISFIGPLVVHGGACRFCQRHCLQQGHDAVTGNNKNAPDRSPLRGGPR